VKEKHPTVNFTAQKQNWIFKVFLSVFDDYLLHSQKLIIQFSAEYVIRRFDDLMILNLLNLLFDFDLSTILHFVAITILFFYSIF